ncbi:Na+/H+ antiporter NhaA [Stackebrandtia soli]|uniref:Na+/H+ antiporter NhaA n=1 Tax=Stackebrandtia soli TaxID=1892856 RepID=UPI0039E89D8F
MPKRKLARATDEFGRYLRVETTGGKFLLVATVLALVAANGPWSEAYRSFSDFRVGPSALHLDLSLATWAADGLLAVFFFVAGLELKREFVSGELSNVRSAMLPVFGAVGGMIAPALVALAVAWGEPGASSIWPIPVATDIAFALAVFAVVASALPTSVRIFMLSLAVVDDLLAILLIAVLFTAGLNWTALAVSIGCVAVYALLQRFRVRFPPLYIVLAVVAWAALHESGIHATIAGVLIAFATRVKPDPGELESPGLRAEHLVQPFSAGFCVPVFAFFAAGITLDGAALAALPTDRLALAVVLGLVVGKLIGVLGGTRLSVWLRLATLPSGVGWRDLIGVCVLAGCGFTVSLLMAELSFEGTDELSRVKAGVLIGSLIASLAAAFLLRHRVRQREDGARP